tara:strand:- start:4060 stop:8490 length:4431 start_codon:yes stop_codon:yes gene_type:complete
MAEDTQDQGMNTFQEGMRMDVDKLNQPNSSYRYGLNGRLIFNRDGSYAWESEMGNKLSFTINPDSGSGVAGLDYKPLGWTGQSDLIIIYSKDSVTAYSEIGLFIVDADGTGNYKTLFNDRNDPNGDLLNFTIENQIEARFVYESDNLIRTYWVDGVNLLSNQPRVFTFKYDNTSPITSTASYSAVSISVHEINLQSEVNMGLIKYVETIPAGGNILSGSYQYSYRLITVTGYRTPWFPLTEPVIVSTDSVSPSNPWDYEMEGSGIDSGKSVELEIKGIDQRFNEIEVLYVYLTNDQIPTQASIFVITTIDGTTMTFDHRSMSGEPILIEEIPVFFQGIKKAKTLNIKDASLYVGNVVEASFEINNIEPVLTGVSIKPYFKNIRSDEYPISSFIDGRNSAVAAAPPISRQSVVAGGVCNKTLHTSAGGVESYDVIDEYSNYKGTQISHLNKGYFRGETYRFGVVFFDLTGFPSFVYHIADLKMPEQYEDTYSAVRLKADGTTISLPTVTLPERSFTTCNFGDYFDDSAIVGLDGSDTTISYLRIMGVEVSGIDITTIKTQISGFMIVRAKCDNSILMQGLIMSCVRDPGGDSTTRPMPFGHDAWWDSSTLDVPTATSDIADIQLLYGEEADEEELYGIRPNTSVFYAPDLDFGFAQLPNVHTADLIKLVSTCYQEGHACVGTENNNGCTPWANQYFTWGEDGGLTPEADRGREGVRKLYRTKNDSQGYPGDPLNDPYPQHGAIADMTYILNLALGAGRDNYEVGIDLKNQTNFKDGRHMGYYGTAVDKHRHWAWGKGNSVFIKHGNFAPNNFPTSTFPNTNPLFKEPTSEGVTTNMGNWICNYTRPNNFPYGGVSESSLERTIFFSTGHYQPVNNPTFDTQGMPANDIFDEIEVWGGDCILDYMGFARLYPRMQDPINWKTDPREYGIGEIFPFESRVHHPLRNAPSQQNPIFSDVGLRPQKELEDADTKWGDGIFYDTDDNKLIEEFDINAVLFYEESIMLFAPKPIRFTAIANFPIRWRYTPNKFYGDTIDTWRIFQVNDFDDLNGEYGAITSSLFLFNQIYSFQQSAFGRLRASDRALIESSNQGSLTTGIGEKLDGIDYVNTHFGNQHQWSLFSSGKAAYWIDVNQRKFCRFAQDGFVALSDVRGLHQFAQNELKYYENHDTPVDGFGITGIYDFENNAAFWSFKRDRDLLLKDVTAFYIVSTPTRVLANDYIIINNKDIIQLTDSGVISVSDIIIPKNSTESGTNELMIFFILFSGLGQINIKQKNPNVAPVLIQSINGANYIKVYRESINDDWIVLTDQVGQIPKYYNTISFNELANNFVGFHNANPSFYFTTKNYTIEYRDSQQFYAKNIGLIGNYFGNTWHSILEPIFNPNAMYPKVFDNFKGNVNYNLQTTLVSLDMITESTLNTINLSLDTRKEYKEDILRFPLRAENQLYRTRGKSLTMILSIDNSTYKTSRISSITTSFRVSNRI